MDKFFYLETKVHIFTANGDEISHCSAGGTIRVADISYYENKSDEVMFVLSGGQLLVAESLGDDELEQLEHLLEENSAQSAARA